jgi:hypothetical protein
MSIPERTDPLTDRPREPDELRRLNLEQDSRGGSMWPWIVGIIAVIFVVSLVYGYKGPISNTASTPPSSSSSTTTGSAQPTPPKVNPLAATPTPVPAIPPADTAH